MYNNAYQKNLCNIFIYFYVITVWRTRKENLRIGVLKHLIVRKFSDYREFIKHMPNTKFRKLTEVLLTIDTEALIDL